MEVTSLVARGRVLTAMRGVGSGSEPWPADDIAKDGPVRREGSAILPGADLPRTGSSLATPLTVGFADAM